MQPTDDFWGGVGTAVGSSPGWMVVGVVLVIGVLLIIAKYIVPSLERIKSRELDIEERRAKNDEERLKTDALIIESQRQTNMIMDGMRQSLDATAAQVGVVVSEIHTSRDGSKSVAATAERIDETTRHTDSLVEDIHNHLIGREGTD